MPTGEELPQALREQAAVFLSNVVLLMIAEPGTEVRISHHEVQEPDGVKVHRFYIQVENRWIGYLIGRDKGTTANAIRRLLRAYVSRHGSDAYVDARIQRLAIDG